MAHDIDGIQIHLDAVGMNGVNIVLAFIMYGVSLGIRVDQFVQVFKSPKAVLLGVLSQFVLLPAFTCLLAILLSGQVGAMMGLGMILVASCPGGNISNFISSFGRGNVELSVCLTSISTAVCVFMTPFNFWLWGSAFLKFAHLGADIPLLQIPIMEVFKTIFILLGLPLCAGLLTSKFFPRFASRVYKPLQRFSVLVFLVIVILAFSGNIHAFLRCIRFIFPVVLLHNFLAICIGYLTGVAGRIGLREQRTLAIETGIQNSGLGLALLLGTHLFDAFPPHGGMLVITAWWGIWHIVSGLAVAFVFRYRPVHATDNN